MIAQDRGVLPFAFFLPGIDKPPRHATSTETLSHEAMRIKAWGWLRDALGCGNQNVENGYEKNGGRDVALFAVCQRRVVPYFSRRQTHHLAVLPNVKRQT
jgi:hypothetical protein